MSQFHATVAAARGFDLLRREPRAAAVWCGLMAFSAAVGTVGDKGSAPLQVAGLLIDLILSVAVIGAAFRAWLRPDARSLFYLRLGADERRLLVSSLVMAAPGLLIVPALRGGVVPQSLAMVALAAGPVWLWWTVRFSLAGALGFQAGRLQIVKSWAATRGLTLKLLVAWFLVMVFIALSAVAIGFVFMIVNAIAAFVSGAKALGPPGAIANLVDAALLGALGGVGLVLFVGVAVTAWEAATAKAEIDETPGA